MSNQPTVSMKNRNGVVLALAFVLPVLLLIGHLFKISVLQNNEYQELANENHFASIPIEANRGSIYDCNGKILAQSATVYKIYIDPNLYRSEIAAFKDNETEKVADAAAEGIVYTPVDINTIENQLITYLAEQLEIEEETVRNAMAENTQYYVLKTKVDKPIADAILEYVSAIPFDAENTVSLSAITRESDTKRYYPQNSLAASVIGFTNSDGVGLYGLEAMYDEYLCGTDGKTISARNVYGDEMPYRYSKTYDAEDGNSLYLTIDTTLQTYLESNLERMVEEFDVNNRAAGIIMNAKTGAILAMATSTGFDLNDPYTIADAQTAAYLETLSDEAYTAAYVEAREKQWKNKTITELYEPGSVFKVITSSAGLEEDVVNLEDTFTCTGAVTVVEGVPPIHCHDRSGHGTQDFTTALTNSCNPAFIEIGRRLGADLFFQYFEAFGLTEKTGIDLPGEASSYYQDLEGMGPIELASCSFGQTNILTPIEMITSYAAVVNGGYLLTPYVVSKIVDTDGNVVMTNETEIRRQVISEETSAVMRQALGDVVNNNVDGNAYIKGYRIGGKSGTSEKIGSDYTEENVQYIASYVCFAPADDPEIIMLIMADEPNKEIAYYGSKVAVPCARRILEKALPYLGYYPEYTAEEQANLDVKVPFLEDKSLAEAQAELAAIGLTAEVVGEGDTVYTQIPITGTTVSKNGTVLLYTEQYNAEQTVVVPNLVGKTLSEANTLLASVGLNYITTGAAADRTDVLIQTQSLEAGNTVPKWSLLELEFGVTAQTSG